MLRCAVVAGIRCCSIGFNCGIDDRAAVEGAEGQGDRKRLDQKSHADGRAAGDDGKTDAGFAQPPHRIPGSIGQRLVLGNQRAVDVGDNELDTGHAAIQLQLADDVVDDGFDCGIDRHGHRPLVRRRRLQRLELAGQQPRRHEVAAACGEAACNERLGAVEKDDADVVAPMHEDFAVGALKRRAGDHRALILCRRGGRSRRRWPAARASGPRR